MTAADGPASPAAENDKKEEAEQNIRCNWIGFMRHGETRKADTDVKNRVSGSRLTKDGLNGAFAVAERFAEWIEERDVAEKVRIVCADTAEARETAGPLSQAVTSAAPIRLEELDPKKWPPSSREKPSDRWNLIAADVYKNAGKLPRDGVLVLVGHDPQVSWLLHHVVEEGHRWLRRRRAPKFPLARGELVMLNREKGTATLEWVLSPSDGDTIKTLQEKVRSKMEMAKLLGAFLTALLVFAAKELTTVERVPMWVGGAGLVLLATGVGAYFVTMYRYDELLMPVRFWASTWRSDPRWGHRGLATRPPSSAAWVLYQNMMLIWNRAFVPATISGTLGALLVSFALESRLGWLAMGMAGGVVMVATAALWSLAKPKLGVND